MTAWVIRAGRGGEEEAWNLESGRAGVGFSEIGDLTACQSRDQVRALVDEAFPGAPAGRLANYTGQLWAMRDAIKTSDLIVMPLRDGGQLAIGICKTGYSYDAAQPDRRRRHHILVDWAPERVARSVLKDDLLNTVNGAMSLFKATRNNAEVRLNAVMRGRVDPGGQTATRAPSQPALSVSENELEEAGVVDPVSRPTLEAIKDRISTHIIENFSGHKLTGLVAEVLTALGWVCRTSPAGADGGVDILAGRGPLGLDSPTLVVEVKSELTAVGAPVVRGLSGAVTSNGADQGLLVAWGGVTRDARAEFTQQRTRIAIWTGDELLEQIFELYPQFGDEAKAKLPLKQTWVLDEEVGE